MKEMPSQRVYSKAFEEKGNPNVVKIEVLSIKDGQIIELKFEQKHSNWRQGVWLKTDQFIISNGMKCDSVQLWIDTAPEVVKFECHTNNGLLWLYNIWDRGDGCESQSWTSGMLVKENQGLRRYCCNDIGFETDFHKLVFHIHGVK